MKYILLVLLFASCCAPHKAPKHVAKDTTSGHFEYYNGTEDMRWVKDSIKIK